MSVPQHPQAVRLDRPTLTDVARIAGVSRQTASRVVRGTPDVAPATVARVQRVVSELGYRPNPAARALSIGRGDLIGVLTHTSGTFGAVSMLGSVERAAGAAGLGVAVATLAAFDQLSVQAAVDRLVRTGCDGIVLIAPWASDGEVLQNLQAPVPLVTTSDVPGFDGPVVSADTVGAAREAVEHLLGLGHSTVWHVAGPQGWNASRLREEGWRAALRARGVAAPDPIGGDWSSRSGYDAGVRLLESATAVFVANDQMALGVLYALAEAGRMVPDDVSVIGFDDAPESEFYQPALTTVRVDGEEHGRQAVEILLAAVNGERPPHRGPVSHELVVRRSVAPPRAA